MTLDQTSGLGDAADEAGVGACDRPIATALRGEGALLCRPSHVSALNEVLTGPSPNVHSMNVAIILAF